MYCQRVGVFSEFPRAFPNHLLHMQWAARSTSPKCNGRRVWALILSERKQNILSICFSGKNRIESNRIGWDGIVLIWERGNAAETQAKCSVVCAHMLLERSECRIKSVWLVVPEQQQVLRYISIWIWIQIRNIICCRGCSWIRSATSAPETSRSQCIAVEAEINLN